MPQSYENDRSGDGTMSAIPPEADINQNDGSGPLVARSRHLLHAGDSNLCAILSATQGHQNHNFGTSRCRWVGAVHRINLGSSAGQIDCLKLWVYRTFSSGKRTSALECRLLG